MDSYKMLSDLVRSFKNLKISLRNFESGEKEVYTIIAVILRSLLTDNSPLILKAFPYLRFAPLKKTLYKINKNTCFYASHELLSADIFNFDSDNNLELKDWLAQRVLNEEITISELIKSVADKEAAHSDNFYNKTLNVVNSFHIGGRMMHIEFMLIVGRYICNILEEEINKNGIMC